VKDFQAASKEGGRQKKDPSEAGTGGIWYKGGEAQVGRSGWGGGKTQQVGRSGGRDTNKVPKTR